ncbi:MAG: hypothetical protein EOO02_10235, partial [Chitinophagaceae bacterium]
QHNRLSFLRNVFHLCIICVLLAFIGCSDTKDETAGAEQKAISLDELATGFKEPPIPARAKVYWWWLNGNTDTVRMKEELVAIKNAGLGGVDIFEIGVPPASDPNHIITAGPAFMGPESLKQIGVALREAGKLDLEVGLGVASSWNAGGSWVEPKHAAKTLYYSKTSFNEGSGNSIKLVFPEITKTKAGAMREIVYADNGRPAWYEEIAILALPAGDTMNLDTTRIINITQNFNPKTEELTWDAPAGKWDIYRYICSNSGEQLLRPSENSKGPIIDHFDSSATRMHMMYFIDRLKPLVGDFKTSALKYLYLASYEAKDFAWTPTLPGAFRKINGYDVYKFLPVVFNRHLMDSGTVQRFTHDFNETFSELMINNHYRKAKEICNSYGLKINSESGGPGHLHHIPVETLKALGSLDIPRGEYWYNRTFFDKDSVVDLIWLVKEIAAASHIYKRGIVEEESFTSYWDWQEGPGDLKKIADRAFCEGMNRVVIHGFTHNPTGIGSPGIAYFAGTHFNDRVTWWPKVKPFNDYLARISFVLQQTNFVSDVLYYYGEDIPNLVPPKNTRFKVGDGYDYEIINTEILLKELDAKDGELVLPGVSRYKLLYVGDQKKMSREVLLKLKSLADKGAIIIGAKPSDVYGLNVDIRATKEVDKIAAGLWSTELPEALTFKSSDQSLGANKSDASDNPGPVNKIDKVYKPGDIGNGKIHSGVTPLKVLQALGIPADFSYSDQQAGVLDYIHYEQSGADFYLIRNTTDQWISRNCSFRSVGKTPEQWDPVSGEISVINLYKQVDKQTAVPISLAPHGTIFVVFKKPVNATRNVPIEANNTFYAATTNATEKDVPFVSFTRNGTYFNNSVKRTANMVNGPWTLTFPANMGAPSSASFPSLISWSESDVKGIRYFSGIAVYNNSFLFDKRSIDSGNVRVILDLGDLSKVAELWVNDKSLGIVWTKPFRYDITEVVKNGSNTLRIEVANTWSNRLTGDAITGEKFTRTNIVKANKNLVPWAELSLIKSGLFGPVTIETVKLLR